MPAWIGLVAIDPAGQPEWLAVTTGFFGTHRDGRPSGR
jgi:hypothetical protein